jgi:hypothetical protein
MGKLITSCFLINSWQHLISVLHFREEEQQNVVAPRWRNLKYGLAGDQNVTNTY